jgi:hypothetical protein
MFYYLFYLQLEFSIDKRRVQFDSHSAEKREDENAALKQLDTNKRELILVSQHHQQDEIETDNVNITIDSASEQKKEPKFIVTLTGVNEQKFLSNMSKKRSYSDMTGNHESDFDMNEQGIILNDEQMDQDEAEEALLAKKKLIRCAFWPMCDKGDQCPFLHPNKPCTAFPNCQFGQVYVFFYMYHF